MAAENIVPPTIEECCHCENGCLNEMCPCFLAGKMCSPNCKCINCKNNEENANERIKAIEYRLHLDPLAFTSEKSLTPDEYEQMRNFIMLTSSIDSEPFKAQPHESRISKVVTPKIITQAMITVLSSPNELLQIQDSSQFDESVENSIATEFLDVMQKIQEYVNKPTQSSTVQKP